eukprot:TRINITY_DN652_c0_g1_i10.p1 TRINITY_DN652_c0_g1~~TRINITY_DN652_c0_g1_i10.p1  ORF type:complete len:1338 (-),score=266.74 TRINITY_DN652_c0_g1_i10:34-3579(-)
MAVIKQTLRLIKQEESRNKNLKIIEIEILQIVCEQYFHKFLSILDDPIDYWFNQFNDTQKWLSLSCISKILKTYIGYPVFRAKMFDDIHNYQKFPKIVCEIVYYLLDKSVGDDSIDVSKNLQRLLNLVNSLDFTAKLTIDRQNITKKYIIDAARKEYFDSYSEFIHQSRFNLNSLNSPLIMAMQEKFTERCTQILREIWEDCLYVLGHPPDKNEVTLIGFGSLSRKEMTPYSDIDCLLLVKDKLIVTGKDGKAFETLSYHYVKSFLILFSYHLTVLGETDSHGFCLDGNFSPLVNFDLNTEYVLTVDTYIENISKGKERTQSGATDVSVMAFCQPCLVTGSSDLFNDLDEKLSKSLNEPASAEFIQSFFGSLPPKYPKTLLKREVVGLSEWNSLLDPPELFEDLLQDYDLKKLMQPLVSYLISMRIILNTRPQHYLSTIKKFKQLLGPKTQSSSTPSSLPPSPPSTTSKTELTPTNNNTTTETLTTIESKEYHDVYSSEMLNLTSTGILDLCLVCLDVLMFLKIKTQFDSNSSTTSVNFKTFKSRLSNSTPLTPSPINRVSHMPSSSSSPSLLSTNSTTTSTTTLQSPSKLPPTSPKNSPPQIPRVKPKMSSTSLHSIFMYNKTKSRYFHIDNNTSNNNNNNNHQESQRIQRSESDGIFRNSKDTLQGFLVHRSDSEGTQINNQKSYTGSNLNYGTKMELIAMRKYFILPVTQTLKQLDIFAEDIFDAIILGFSKIVNDYLEHRYLVVSKETTMYVHKADVLKKSGNSTPNSLSQSPASTPSTSPIIQSSFQPKENTPVGQSLIYSSGIEVRKEYLDDNNARTLSSDNVSSTSAPKSDQLSEFHQDDVNDEMFDYSYSFFIKPLRSLPSSNGWRPSIQAEEDDWISTLHILYIPYDDTITDSFTITVKSILLSLPNPSISETPIVFSLNNKLVDILTQPFVYNSKTYPPPIDRKTGVLNPSLSSVLPGRHIVLPINLIDGREVKIHMKFLPDAPGRAFAVNYLATRITGNPLLFDYSVLCVKTGNKEYLYPVMISQTVDGNTLETEIDKLQKSEIDPYSFGQEVILAMIANYEDCHSNNVVVTKSKHQDNSSGNLLKLTVIDNEQSFVLRENHAAVKTILYCFDMMEEKVHPDLKAYISQLDPIQVLEGWIEGEFTLNRQSTIVDRHHGSVSTHYLFVSVL